MLERFNSYPTFMKRIVTDDETCQRNKSTSFGVAPSNWTETEKTTPKSEFWKVPEGQAVNKDYCLRGTRCLKRPGLWEKKNNLERIFDQNINKYHRTTHLIHQIWLQPTSFFFINSNCNFVAPIYIRKKT